MYDNNKIYYCRETQTTGGIIVELFEDYDCSCMAVGGYTIDYNGNKINAWGVANEPNIVLGGESDD